MHVNHKLKFTVNFYMVKDSICMLQIFGKIWRRVKLSSKVSLFIQSFCPYFVGFIVFKMQPNGTIAFVFPLVLVVFTHPIIHSFSFSSCGNAWGII